MRFLIPLILWMLPLAAAAEPDPDGEPVEVMIIGTWHFKNSGLDVINIDGPNVLTAERQAELEEVVSRLMPFDPTLVALEQITEAPDYLISGFQDAPADIMATNPNERVQIGYRLAAAAGLSEVYGIDEQPSEGEPDYFPYGALVAHADATGRKDELDALISGYRDLVTLEKEKVFALTMSEALAEVNDGFLSSAQMYYATAIFDEGESQPSAELQGYWFMRNTKIWSKLLDVVEPGDR
ncbi:MAG: DUF5694 domain-containing protein, partial [Pseudomonadota bacterium]